ncbi:MAG: RluA family pseudouridine synthase [Candidatus Latescibacterota bacterium]
MERQKKKITLSCKVDPFRSGWTIVEFLAHRFPYHTAARWTQRVGDQQVMVNGASIDADGAVLKDDLIQYTIFHAEPEVDFRYSVVYEDEDILAVSKSGNIPVHACGVFITHTLISKLKESYGESINLAHRLDRETSGLVLLSKNKQAARMLGRMFQVGEVTKQYITIVQGRVPDKQFEVNAPVAKVEALASGDGLPGRQEWLDGTEEQRDKASYLPKREVNFASGKAALTRFAHVRYTGDCTVLKAVPVTGRTNQIRVHLAHHGYPVVGDKVYGLTGNVKEEAMKDGLTARVREALVMERQALHCRALDFAHPVTAGQMRLEAPVPDDMKWAYE